MRDNTQSNAIYAMETAAFSTGAVAADARRPRPFRLGRRRAIRRPRVAAPFAVLDTIYTAQAKVLSVAPGTAFPLLRVFWSVNNVPAERQPALGPDRHDVFSASEHAAAAIYVLGKENVDTDEYDASVIAHEWGHYYQSAFSRDDSPGGSHSMADSWTGGWPSRKAGATPGPALRWRARNYTDSVGVAAGARVATSTCRLAPAPIRAGIGKRRSTRSCGT